MNSSNEPKQLESYFIKESSSNHSSDIPWYQANIDVVFPAIIFGIGLFQFILRKWILPVSKDIIERLENQFPSQGLIYLPEFGVFLMLAGLILFIVFYI